MQSLLARFDEQGIVQEPHYFNRGRRCTEYSSKGEGYDAEAKGTSYCHEHSQTNPKILAQAYTAAQEDIVASALKEYKVSKTQPETCMPASKHSKWKEEQTKLPH